MCVCCESSHMDNNCEMGGLWAFPAPKVASGEAGFGVQVLNLMCDSILPHLVPNIIEDFDILPFFIK